jgi:hypothetical protein
MFYIITYSSDDKIYLNKLIEYYPDIIILNFENKINEIINFCKNKNPDDIVCSIDSSDFLILESNDIILEKYKSFNKELIFSKGSNPSSIFIKYIEDKLFGKYKNIRLNSSLYIGTCRSIIDFWQDIKENNNFYVIERCNIVDYVMIDEDNKIFYNNSLKDNMSYKLNISNISIINKENIFVDKLKFNSLLHYFIFDFFIIILIIIILFLLRNYNNIIKIIIVIIIFSLFLEYELFIKHIHNVSNINKFLYLIIDFIHILLVFFIIYLFINLEGNIRKLIILNTSFFIMILLFFYYKRCILTIIAYNFLNSDYELISWNGPFDRIRYLLFVDKEYKDKYKSKDELFFIWFNEQKISIFLLIILNLYILYKNYPL